MGQAGQYRAGLMDIYAVALSVGLQHQVPLVELITPGLDLYFVPNGRTDDPQIPRVRSVIDYVARRLAIDWLSYPDRASLGVFTHRRAHGRRQNVDGHRGQAYVPAAGGWGYGCLPLGDSDRDQRSGHQLARSGPPAVARTKANPSSNSMPERTRRSAQP